MNAELFSQHGGKSWPRAAAGNQQVISGVVAPFDGGDTDPVHHVFCGDLDDAVRGAVYVDSGGIGNVILDNLPGEIFIDFHPAAQQPGIREITGCYQGVGHRRPGAAAHITGRSRIGLGAVRADLQNLQFIQTGNTAATGADAGDVDHWQTHPDTGDVGLVDDVRQAVPHQADVETGAPHIDGDDVLIAQLTPVPERRDGTCCRS